MRPRNDNRGVDLISDALPFGRLWYVEVSDAIEYAKHRSRLHHAVIRVPDGARLKEIMGSVREALRCIDTYSYKGGMTSDAEKKAHAQLAEFMTKGF
jgi:hypothetical protein